MTVTLSTEELNKFESKLSGWYAKRAEFVINNLMGTTSGFPMFAGECNILSRIEKLNVQFCKDNPRPDWRSLL